jgi:hypothetical protein
VQLAANGDLIVGGGHGQFGTGVLGRSHGFRVQERKVCLVDQVLVHRHVIGFDLKPARDRASIRARALATVARHERHHLLGYSTQCDPHPALAVLVMHE